MKLFQLIIAVLLIIIREQARATTVCEQEYTLYEPEPEPYYYNHYSRRHRKNIQPERKYSGTIKCHNVSLDVDGLLVLSNEMTKISKDKYQIHFTNGNISILESSAFMIYDRYNIQKMHIQNCLLKEIEPEAFRAVKYLEDLNLSKNNLTEINKGIFNSLAYLTDFNVSYNQINLIQNDSFDGMENLTVMDFSNNKLGILSSFTFRGLKSVTHLDVSSNAIHELNDNTFNDLNDLTTLILSDNNLKVLNESAFSDLVRLTNLSLRNNNISFIDRNCFGNLQSLIHLDLSRNALTQLEFGTFTGLNSLRYLNISYNNLTVIDFYYSLSNLEMLAINNNKISFIDITNLKHYCQNLTSIVFFDNPLECRMLTKIYGDLITTKIETIISRPAKGPNVNGIGCILGSSSKTPNYFGKAIANDNSELTTELKSLRKKMLVNSIFYRLLENSAEQFLEQLDNGDEKFGKCIDVN